MAATEMRMEVYDVTPELAGKWLSLNSESQRNLNRSNVERYAVDMKDGNWQLTHQGICFNKTGELVDGQHRLAAVVLSGETVRMAVFSGMPVEYQSTIDQGANRTLAQVLGVPPAMVATLNALNGLATGDYTKRPRLSSALALKTYDKFREHLDPVWQLAKAAQRKRGQTPAGVMAACTYAWPVDPDKVSSFLIQVRDGELIQRGDPAYALRNWLTAGHRATSQDVALATLNTLRYELNGLKLHNVYTGETGYRAFCSRRRALGLPNTPSASHVETMSLNKSPDANAGARKNTLYPVSPV
jgi:hypothetical protein